MKHLFFIAAPALAAALALLLLPSCDTDAGRDGSGGSGGACVLTVRFAEAGSRTVLPSASAEVVLWEIEGSGPGGAVFRASSLVPWVRAELEPGLWDFAAKGSNAEGLALLAGNASAELEAGGAVDLAIQLQPRAGTGSLTVAFAMGASPPEGLAADIRLAACSGGFSDARRVVAPFAEQSWPELASGYYSLEVELDGVEAARGLSEVARVLPDSATSFLADFSGEGSLAAFRVLVPETAPLVPRLPAIRRWPEYRALPAAALSGGDGVLVSAFLDGAPLQPPPIALGRRRLDLVAVSADARRAGAAGATFEVFRGTRLPELEWHGSWGPAADAVAALPAGHGFVDVSAATGAAADGLRTVVALDGLPPGATASGTAASSSLHVFSAAADGSLYFRDAIPLRVDGTLRSADRAALSGDGTRALVWNADSSWLAFADLSRPAGTRSFELIDAASLGEGAAVKVRGAAFSVDGSVGYLLSASPYRLISFGTADRARMTSLTLDAALIGSLSFGCLAVDEGGRALLLASSGDAAAVVQADGTVAVLRKIGVGGVVWLDGPVDAAAIAGGFLVLCAQSGCVGRITDAGTAERLTETAEETVLGGMERIAVQTAAAGAPIAFAATGGGESGQGRLFVWRAGTGDPSTAVLAETVDQPGLAYASAPAWLASGVLASGELAGSVLVSDGAARLLASFGEP